MVERFLILSFYGIDVQIKVDFERERVMPGWVPRRLGQVACLNLHIHTCKVGDLVGSESQASFVSVDDTALTESLSIGLDV
jgi:hypothetical protein